MTKFFCLQRRRGDYASDEKVRLEERLTEKPRTECKARVTSPAMNGVAPPLSPSNSEAAFWNVIEWEANSANQSNRLNSPFQASPLRF